MKLALVNLPHPCRVVRHPWCSFNAPLFSYPPIELMSLAAVAQREGHQALVIDAIGENLQAPAVGERLSRFAPEMILSLLGLEIFEQDLHELRRLREFAPQAQLGAFGHYPSLFPDATIAAGNLDFIIRDEPELTLAEMLAARAGGGDGAAIAGLSTRGNGGGPAHHPPRPRTKALDELPFPDYGQVPVDKYYEFLWPRPFVMLQSARGCPYRCDFCLRSYGDKLTMRSAANVLDELGQLHARYRLRSFRFIDDTFTAIPERTVEIARGIGRELPGVIWGCLSRIDTLDEPTVRIMAENGCRRMFLGVESGSDRILRRHGKHYGVAKVPEVVAWLHRHGIEVGTYLMAGHPEETAEDFAQTIELAVRLPIDYAEVMQVVPYPGTPLYEQYRDDVEFSLVPYRNEWKSPGRRRELQDWQREFYRRFYLRPGYVRRHVGRFVRDPGFSWHAARTLGKFLFTAGRPVRGDVI